MDDAEWRDEIRSKLGSIVSLIHLPDSQSDINIGSRPGPSLLPHAAMEMSSEIGSWREILLEVSDGNRASSSSDIII
jgi:hypothetical protein